MTYALGIIIFGLIGFVTGNAGLTVKRWQFWALIFLALAAWLAGIFIGRSGCA
jgi:hypothetical protein